MKHITNNWIKHSRHLIVATAVGATLMACGGGGSGADGQGQNASAETAVFRLLNPNTSRMELFAGNVNGGTPVNLTNMDNASGRVDQQFVVSPDGQWVAYLADAETDGLTELYVSRTDGSEIGRKMSPAPVYTQTFSTSRSIDNLLWSPDSSQLAYVSDQEIFATWELYVSNINGAIGVKVSSEPLSGRETNTDVIRRFNTSPNNSNQRSSDVVQWSPDGSRLAYIADQDVNQVFELYTTTAQGNDNVVKVSAAMTTGGDIPWDDKRKAFAWAPDSSRIAYRADQNSDNVFELFVAEPTGAALPTRVSHTAGSQDDVFEFAWASDSSRLAYSMYRDSVGKTELYTVLPEAGATPVQVNGQLQANGNVQYFDWAADASRIAYVADQNVNERYELFVSFPDTSVGNIRVSGDTFYDGLDADGSASFIWSPDSSRIAYDAYQQFERVRELYVSTADGSSNIKLSGSLSSSNDLWQYRWSPDSQYVAYTAEQNQDGITELFVSAINGARETSEADGGGPAFNAVLNPMLVDNGDVDRDGFLWSSNSQRVKYFADQEEDGVIEFYSSSRDGDFDNVKISDIETTAAPVTPISFSSDIYPQLSSCGGCHGNGSTFDWYQSGNASGTWGNMNAEGYFNNQYIVEKLDGTRSHSGGSNSSLAADFAEWIEQGASNN